MMQHGIIMVAACLRWIRLSHHHGMYAVTVEDQEGGGNPLTILVLLITQNIAVLLPLVCAFGLLYLSSTLCPRSIYSDVIDGSPLFLRDGLPFMLNVFHLGILFSMSFLLVFLSLGGLLHISQHAPGSLSHLRFDDLACCY